MKTLKTLIFVLISMILMNNANAQTNWLPDSTATITGSSHSNTKILINNQYAGLPYGQNPSTSANIYDSLYYTAKSGSIIFQFSVPTQLNTFAITTYWTTAGNNGTQHSQATLYGPLTVDTFEILTSSNGTDYKSIGIYNCNSPSTGIVFNSSNTSGYDTVSFGVQTAKFWKIQINSYYGTFDGENSPQIFIYTMEFGYNQQKAAIAPIEETANVINVYPNPSANNMNITLNNSSNSQVELTLVDLSGKTVYHTVTNSLNTTISKNDLNLKSGIYFLTIVSDHSTSTQKILFE